MTVNRTRQKQIKFYVSEKEYDQLKIKVEKSRLTQSEYLIKSALNKRIIIIDGLKEILLELSKEGNNLNEIAQNFNIEDRDGVKELKEMKEKLMSIWDKIEKTLNKGCK